MSLHDLPRETIDHIIRLLDDDGNHHHHHHHRTLNACSLVGWVFLPSCRHVMFSTISIEYEELGTFLGVIDHPLSTVTPALRGIRFKQKPECLRHFDDDAVDGSAAGPKGDDHNLVPVVSREVMAILGSQIRTIQWEGIPPRGGSVGFWNFMAELKGVREVEMESGAFEMRMRMMPMGKISDKVVGWVCGLSELEELSVVKSSSSLSASLSASASWTKAAAPLEWQMPVLEVPSWTAVMEEEGEGGGEGVKARNAGRMRVSLDIGDWDQMDVVRWLMIQSPVPCIRTLRIGSSRKGFWDGGSACDVHLLKKFIEKVGSVIENLYILLPGDSETDVLESLDPSRCINLRTMHIDGFQIGPSDRTQRTALEILLEKIVNCADGPYLRDITLTIEVDPHVRHMLAFFGIPDVVLFRKFDWGRIPEILAKGAQGPGGIVQRRGLKLIVQRCSKYHHEGIEQILREGVFRELDEHASLSVRFDGGERSSVINLR